MIEYETVHENIFKNSSINHDRIYETVHEKVFKNSSINHDRI